MTFSFSFHQFGQCRLLAGKIAEATSLITVQRQRMLLGVEHVVYSTFPMLVYIKNALFTVAVI